MEKLIEKIKGLDKKVLIGAGIGVVALIILIVALVIGLGNDKPVGGNKGESQNGVIPGTQTEGDESEKIGTEEFGTENLGSEMGTEFETEVETETTESEKESQSNDTTQPPGIGGTTVTQPEDVGGVEQKPVTTTPSGQEIFGKGTAEEPFEINPNGNTMSFTTLVAVPAGSSLHFSVSRTEGKQFVIEDADAYVVFNGTTYKASSGKVSFIAEDERALPTDFLHFEIGNNGSTDKMFTIKLYDVWGTRDNPEVLTTLGDTISLEKGNSDGWAYKYYATQSGTIRFYIDSMTKNSILRITNNANSMQRGFDITDELSTDENGNKYIEMPVSANDELLIEVFAEPNSKFQYPATTVTWHGEYK